MNKLYFNSGKMDDKVNGVKSKANDAIDDLDSIYKSRYKINVSVFNKTSYYSDIGTAYTKGTAVCQAAVDLMVIIDGAAEKYEQCEKELKKEFDEFDLLTCGYENLVRDYLGMDSINTVDGQRLENACKIVIGTCAVVIGVAVAAYAAPAALTNIVIHTAVKVTVSTAIPTIQAAINGENVYDTFADSFMDAGIDSMFDNVFRLPTQNAKGLGKFALKSAEKIASITTKTLLDNGVFGEDVSLSDYIGDVVVGVVATGVGELFSNRFPKPETKDFMKTLSYSMRKSTITYVVKTGGNAIKNREIKFSDTAWSAGQTVTDTFMKEVVDVFFPEPENVVDVLVSETEE